MIPRSLKDLSAALFDATLGDPAQGNRHVGPEDVGDILETIGDPTIGQQVPGIIYPNLADPVRYFILDGNRRNMACRIAGKPFLAYMLPAAPTELELIELRLALDLHKHTPPCKKASYIQRHMTLAGGTQEASGKRYGLSGPSTSKLLELLKLPPQVQAHVDAKRIGQDAGRIIASLPTPELMAEVGELVARERLKRWAVIRIVKGKLGVKEKGKVPTKKIKEGPVSVAFPGDWPILKLAEGLIEMAKKLRRSGEDGHGQPVPV